MLKLTDLRTLFGDAGKRRAENFARLKEWLPETLEQVSKNLKETPIPEGGPYNVFCYSTKLDTADLTAKDLQEIAPYIEQLHELCMEYNAGLEIAGFDRLPRDGVSTRTSYHGGAAVMIEVDTSRTYSHFSHPRFLDLHKRGIQTKTSTERPRTCQL